MTSYKRELTRVNTTLEQMSWKAHWHHVVKSQKLMLATKLRHQTSKHNEQQSNEVNATYVAWKVRRVGGIDADHCSTIKEEERLIHEVDEF